MDFKCIRLKLFCKLELDDEFKRAKEEDERRIRIALGLE